MVLVKATLTVALKLKKVTIKCYDILVGSEGVHGQM